MADNCVRSTVCVLVGLGSVQVFQKGYATTEATRTTVFPHPLSLRCRGELRIEVEIN